MRTNRKLGNMLMKNLFSLFIVFSIVLSIFKIQNLRIKHLYDVVLVNDIIQDIDIIKNELYFNEQYRYLNETTYIDFGNLENRNYKYFNDIFENSTINSSYYKLFYRDDVIKISCFVDGDELLSDEFEMFN